MVARCAPEDVSSSMHGRVPPTPGDHEDRPYRNLAGYLQSHSSLAHLQARYSTIEHK